MAQLKYPKVNPRKVKLMNKLIGLNGHFSVDIAGAPYQLSFIPDQTGQKSAIQIGLELSGIEMTLELGSFFFEDFIRTKFEDVDLQDLMPELKAAIIESALEDFLTDFEARSGLKVKLNSVELNVPAISDEGLHSFSFMLNEAGRKAQVYGRLLCDDQGADFLYKVVKDLQVDPQDIHGFQPPIRLYLGQTRLPQKELKNLNKNDVVLLDQCSLYDDHKILLMAPQIGVFKAKITGTELQITNRLEGIAEMTGSDDDFNLDDFLNEDFGEKPAASKAAEQSDLPKKKSKKTEAEPTDMADDEVVQGQSEAAAYQMTAIEASPIETSAMDEMAIRLSFELGRLNLPLEKLRALNEGSVIELGPMMTPSTISVKAGGQVFAKGELVEIEGRYGVRIVDLYK